MLPSSISVLKVSNKLSCNKPSKSSTDSGAFDHKPTQQKMVTFVMIQYQNKNHNMKYETSLF